MAFPLLQENLNNISQLSDEPNDVGTDALSADELKERFDKAGNQIKQFINEVLIPYLQSVYAAGDIGITEIPGLTDAETVQTALETLKSQLDNTSTGSIPDRSLTANKIKVGAITAAELANQSVTAAKVATGAISDDKISSDKLSGTVLKSKTVGTSNIADKAVTATQLADYAVETSKIKDLNVTAAKLATNAVQTVKIKDGAVTANKLAADAVKLHFNDVAVPVSAFQQENTYEDFSYRAELQLPGVTEDMVPELIFSLQDAMSGNIAPIAESIEGGLYIYAATVPEEALSIPTVILWRTGEQSTGSSSELYSGDYEITPTFTQQQLETEGKIMEENVIAQAIPVARASNTAGGQSVLIGG